MLFRVISWIDFGVVLKDDPRINTNPHEISVILLGIHQYVLGIYGIEHLIFDGIKNDERARRAVPGIPPYLYLKHLEPVVQRLPDAEERIAAMRRYMKSRGESHASAQT